MICVLRHKKSGKYISGAIGPINMRNMRWTGDTTKVQFSLSTNMAGAKLTENPNMDMVNKFGCEAIVVKLKDTQLETRGNIYESNL